MTADEYEFAPGTILLNKLEIIGRLGGGGMGVVYEVEHRLTGHRRALKVVRAQFSDRPRFMKRLLREARVAGTLGTAHVVETYDAGRLDDGSAYVLMELLEGRTLYDAIQDAGQLVPTRAASIIAQVAEGMSIAHAAGIVHRDLKPENIFLVGGGRDDERVKILDFGVSKFERTPAVSRLTAKGTLVGTPYYMSPEQAGGKRVDARTDVYAMGVMLYEALTGRLPFDAQSVGELFVRIGAGEYVPLESRRPDLPASWYEIVPRALRRDLDGRYQSAEALRRDLLPLASRPTAKRAETVSEGTRARGGTPDRPALPRPPNRPAELRTPPPTDLALEAGEPPPERPDLRSGRTSASSGDTRWRWALGGAALVLAVVVPLQLRGPPSDDGPPRRPQTRPAEPPTPAPALGRRAAPTEPLPHLGGAEPLIDAGPLVSPANTPRRRSRRTPANAAGLDDNPYR